jgi:hypothetical protein
LDYLRPYYKLASHNVHAQPKGILFKLGLVQNQDILLAGPSNYGFVTIQAIRVKCHYKKVIKDSRQFS